MRRLRRWQRRRQAMRSQLNAMPVAMDYVQSAMDKYETTKMSREELTDEAIHLATEDMGEGIWLELIVELIRWVIERLMSRGSIG